MQEKREVEMKKVEELRKLRKKKGGKRN